MAKGKEEAAKKCVISRKTFVDKAKPLSIKINDVLHSGDLKEFATGSFGWMSQGKITIEIDGVPVKVQMNCLFTVVDSKLAE